MRDGCRDDASLRGLYYTGHNSGQAKNAGFIKTVLKFGSNNKSVKYLGQVKDQGATIEKSAESQYFFKKPSAYFTYFKSKMDLFADKEVNKQGDRDPRISKCINFYEQVKIFNRMGNE